jgi:hypothetical protein
MKLNEQFLEYLKYMNTTVKNDNQEGKQWKYCNSTKKKAKGFDAARKAGKYLINCVDGPQWALKAIGVKCLSWYGGEKCIVWLNDHAKKDVEKYFDIIETGGKTPKYMYDHMVLCDGDILLGYSGMNHTNVYYGGEKSFDSGHAYASGSGEGANIRKFIGALSHKNTKVYYILRFKDKFRAHYRVQAGAYTDINKYKAQEALIKQKGFAVKMVQEDNMYKCQVGLYSGKTNAERKVSQLKAKGIDAFVKEV